MHCANCYAFCVYICPVIGLIFPNLFMLDLKLALAGEGDRVLRVPSNCLYVTSSGTKLYEVVFKLDIFFHMDIFQKTPLRKH